MKRSIRLARPNGECVRKSMQYVMDVYAACSCMREVDRAGRVVRWNYRQYIYGMNA